MEQSYEIRRQRENKILRNKPNISLGINHLSFWQSQFEPNPKPILAAKPIPARPGVASSASRPYGRGHSMNPSVRPDLEPS
jgi:hypothetical protein